MAKSFTNADGVMLFACTKCNSRHPFEELSQGHQLCKGCKNSFHVIKCNYCRSEFQQETDAKSSSICKKCEQLQEQHGKPGPCAYCNIIAAFIGTKCQRCNNSEKKYGSPLSCQHCKQKCAFDRKDPDSKIKVDGKILCWLCTMAYKRTLARARQKEAILKSASGHHRLSSKDPKSFSSSSSRQHSSSSTNGGQRHHSNLSSNANSNGNSTSSSHQRSSSNRQSGTSHSSHKDSSSASANKKSRIDISGASNGHLTSNLSSLSDASRFVDSNNADLTAAMTQLKDQVAALNKKLQLKEKELLSKDQQIADLKSTSAREQRELREKISTLQKQHSERISEMQVKLITMQKEMASNAKASRRAPPNPTSGYVEPPMVI